jgi:hypothetical protein
VMQLGVSREVMRNGRAYYVCESQCSSFPWWVCWADRGTETLPNGRELRRLVPYTGETEEGALLAAYRGEDGRADAG